MQQNPEPSDRVEPVIPPGASYPYPPSTRHPERASGGWKELAKIILPAALVFAYVFFTSGNYVTEANNTKNFQSVATSITQLSDRLKGDEGTIATISTQLAGISKQIQDVQASYGSLSNTITAQSRQIDTLPSKADLVSLQSQLAILSGTVSSLPTTIKTDYTVQITTLQGKLDTLSAQVTNLATTANTTTTTTGTGVTTTDGIYVVVTGNPFTGSQVLGFSAISGNASSAQALNFQVTNNTGKAITNIQFAIGLELLDANSNIITAGLPAISPVATVGITSSGTMAVWSQQSTGINYILGFTNSTPTGIFGGIGVLSQGTGTAQYTITVTVSNTGTGATTTPSFNIFPIVKVISYS